MVELILNESGVPMDRPHLKRLKDSFENPIDELVKLFPGNRVISGFEITVNDQTMTITEGVLLYKGKLYTAPAYQGSVLTDIHFYETISKLDFNVGTRENPNYQPRDAFITRSVAYALVGASETFSIASLLRGRKVLEYLAKGVKGLNNLYNNGDSRDIEVFFDQPIISPGNNFTILITFESAFNGVPLFQDFQHAVTLRFSTGFTVRFRNIPINQEPFIMKYIILGT